MFTCNRGLKSANVRFSTRQLAASCITSLLFKRANDHPYSKTLTARDCALVGVNVPLVQSVFYTNNECLYGQWKGSFAAVELRTAYRTPYHTGTVINICMDSTKSQSSPAISGGAVHIAHEYPRGVHSGLWEQGVCVVFSCIRTREYREICSFIIETRLEPRFVCYFCLLPSVEEAALGVLLRNIASVCSELETQWTMPGKAAVTVSLQPSDNAATTAASQKSCPFVLKKIMEIPPPNILEEGDDGKIKMLHTFALWIDGSTGLKLCAPLGAHNLQGCAKRC